MMLGPRRPIHIIDDILHLSNSIFLKIHNDFPRVTMNAENNLEKSEK